MLCLFSSSRGFPYPALSEIYRQSLQEAGAAQYPEEENTIQQALAWEDFSSYIRLDFFPQEESLYALWQEEGRYVSAARIEPYRDGWLLSGLETAPDFRGKGYASALLSSLLETLEEQGVQKVYSHVRKENHPSLAVHKRAGFVIFKDSAVYLDGSADSCSYTLLKILEKKEKMLDIWPFP